MDLTGIGAILDFGGKIIDRVIPSAEAREAAKLALAQLDQNGKLAELYAETDLAKGQLEINKVEAASSSVFTSGWRPFIGWTCGFGMAYVAVIEPIARFIAKVFYHYDGAFPVIDTSLTMQVLMGILGLGAMRMGEKIKGVASR